MRVAVQVTLTAIERRRLETWSSARSTTVRLVERSKIVRGVFTSVKELEARLAEYIDTYNENPQPFVWTKSAKQILEKVGRARQALGH